MTPTDIDPLSRGAITRLVRHLTGGIASVTRLRLIASAHVLSRRLTLPIARRIAARMAHASDPVVVFKLAVCVTAVGLGGCNWFGAEWKEPPRTDPSQAPEPMPPDEIDGTQCDATERPLRCLFEITASCAVEVDAACIDGVAHCPSPSESIREACLRTEREPPTEPEPDPETEPETPIADSGPPTDDGPPPDTGADMDEPVDAEIPGCDARDEVCDGVDDDCDGRIDEGFGVGDACLEGEGLCARVGVIRCSVDGETTCHAPQAQVVSDGSQCDGLDDDCDGRIDEGPPCNGGPPGLALAGPRFADVGRDASYWAYMPAGTYDRGADDDRSSAAERPAHQVEITRAFLIGQHEVTVGEWRAVMGTEPAFSKASDDKPVERISWYEALAFTNALSESDGLEPCYLFERCHEEDDIGAGCDAEQRFCDGLYYCTGVSAVADCDGYRLPTEAEWEGAVRGHPATPADEATAYWFGDDEDALRDHENCDGPFGSETEAVDARGPNPAGLFHALGNVGEWVFDAGEYYSAVPGAILVDPVCAPADEWLGFGPMRVARGGSPGAGTLACRSSSRIARSPHARYWHLGLRLAKTVRDAPERIVD